ncbi:MAG: hypothetical protein V4456_11275 [Bacteroidota bacterium]
MNLVPVIAAAPYLVKQNVDNMKNGETYIEKLFINNELIKTTELIFKEVEEKEIYVFDIPGEHNAVVKYSPLCYPIHEWQILPGQQMKTIVSKL